MIAVAVALGVAAYGVVVAVAAAAHEDSVRGENPPAVCLPAQHNEHHLPSVHSAIEHTSFVFGVDVL